MTKTDEVRQLLRLGFTVGETEFWTKVSRKRIQVIRWRDNHPGYHAEKMAKYRKHDPEGKYAKQIQRATQKVMERYHSDPEFRETKLMRAKNRY